jgi:hypothetical protein
MINADADPDYETRGKDAYDRYNQRDADKEDDEERRKRLEQEEKLA